MSICREITCVRAPWNRLRIFRPRRSSLNADAQDLSEKEIHEPPTVFLFFAW